MVGLNDDDRLVGGLLLVLEASVLENLAVDDPVVVNDAALLALLTRQQANQPLLPRLLLDLSLLPAH